MKMHITFDNTDRDKAILTASSLEPYTDVFEIGSLLLYKYGEEVVKLFKEKFPNKILVVDAKIIDNGKELAALFADAGSDWITVMAGASSSIIRNACAVAHEKGKKVLLDLLDSNSVGQSALEAQSLGVDALLIHRPTSKDQELFFLDIWEMIKGNTQLPIYVSSNGGPDVIRDLITLNPAGIIFGKNITHADNPVSEAQSYYQIISAE